MTNPDLDEYRQQKKYKHFLEYLVEILQLLKNESLSSNDLFVKRPITRSDRFYNYVHLLIERGLVTKDGRLYRITEDGRKFLKTFS
jgi:predicted transcriptional regulator